MTRLILFSEKRYVHYMQVIMLIECLTSGEYVPLAFSGSRGLGPRALGPGHVNNSKKQIPRHFCHPSRALPLSLPTPLFPRAQEGGREPSRVELHGPKWIRALSNRAHEPPTARSLEQLVQPAAP